MNKRQICNPYLPIDAYIPDGEPHIFGDRVYIYGSHDKEGGHTFCMLDYVTYSAPVNDLTDWRYEGVIFRADQDPDYHQKKYMYAPDVVQGNDGKYYLYYAMSGDYGVGGYTGTIHVAVCDSPCGAFSYLGEVRNPDGTPMKKYVCFDPAVLNDNGVIRLYYGTQYSFEEQDDFLQNESLIHQEMDMFGRTREEILSYLSEKESCVDGDADAPDSIMGTVHLILEDDMLTVKENPKHIIPYRVKGTPFESHPFFEGSSMRKVGNKYYFVYSSMQNHELCYAVSDHPDRGFSFGGTIVSNGDIGFEGRTDQDKHNMTGTTHGSIIEIENQWYVFYHRLTHKSDYSRQACAEKISILEDGSIPQVEITSCGLSPAPLSAEKDSKYPATIACIITNGHMPHGCNSIYTTQFPNVTHITDATTGETIRLIAEIEDGTLIGYKYFAFQNTKKICITARTETDTTRISYEGPTRQDERCDQENRDLVEKNPLRDIHEAMYFEVRFVENGPLVGTIPMKYTESWESFGSEFSIPDGVSGLFLTYKGNQKAQIKDIYFL